MHKGSQRKNNTNSVMHHGNSKLIYPKTVENSEFHDEEPNALAVRFIQNIAT